MAYQGRQPGVGVRNRFIYTATASQTTFSGTDSNGLTLAYQDGAYVDVYLNGVLLIPVTDYTSTTKTSVTLTTGATSGDAVEILCYDIASIADTVSKSSGGTFDGAVTVAGNFSVDGGTIKLDGNYPVGTNNVALGDAAGDSSLYSSTTGNYNTAVGQEALTSNTTASYNTAVGYQALYINTTGQYSTAFGGRALYSQTTGTYNDAIGYEAGYNLTTGIKNTLLGHAAGYAVTTAGDNVFVGANSGQDTTTGSSNTALGRDSLANNTTASNNTAVGYQALYTNTTSANNAAFGNKALHLATGTLNTALGTGAGRDLSSGAKNTIIGAYGGNENGLDIRTSNNYIVLSDGDGVPRGFFNNSGYLKVAPSAGDLHGITGAYHEIVTASAGGNALRLRQANASFNDTISRVVSNRTTTNNTYYFMDCLDSTGTQKFRVADSGNVTNTNNSYGSISDAKLKENITDATPKLDKLNQVRVVNYNLIGDEKKQLGVIAQELEKIFPSIVDETADRDEEGNDLGTTTKSVKYSVFVPMLIKAIQEQQATITALTARITALENL
jgi:trimeric autotransporter adhesin